MNNFKLTLYPVLIFLCCSLFFVGQSTASKTESSSIIVINPIEIPTGKEKEALAIWDTYAEYFGRQPGFIGTKLHRSLDPKAKFHLINVAEWENSEDFMRALTSDEIKKIGAGFPEDMPHYPSMYEIIRR